MKVVVLANANNIHTQRWVNSLAQRGVIIHLLSQHGTSERIDDSVTQYSLPFSGGLGYFLNVFKTRQIIAQVKPHLLHAHYASGYGTLGRLAHFQPYFLSVWGADVFDVPRQSRLMSHLVKKNLSAATVIGSTSHCMKQQTESLLNKKTPPVIVTPFGIDTTLFRPTALPHPTTTPEKKHLIIGTVKVLHPKYGVDTLISGFALFVKRQKETSHYRLRIVGDGPQRSELEAQVAQLGIQHLVDFVGRVAHNQVPEELCKLDIYVAVSRLDSESFGVAVLEASACERPVIVSDAGGLPEVVNNRETGIIVQRESPEQLAQALTQLCDNPTKCAAMGKAGREWVMNRYRWEESVDIMLNAYDSLLTKS